MASYSSSACSEKHVPHFMISSKSSLTPTMFANSPTAVSNVHQLNRAVQGKHTSKSSKTGSHRLECLLKGCWLVSSQECRSVAGNGIGEVMGAACGGDAGFGQCPN